MKLTILKKTVIATAVVAALTGAYSLGSAHSFPHALATPVTSTATDLAPQSSPASVKLLPDMSAIVARNGAAVVNISVTASAKKTTLRGMPQLDPNDPFYEFFRHFGMPAPRGDETPEIHGMGSGFIISDDGFVLTNAHVVDGADEVVVKLTDKREFKAKVLGVDKPTDVAVLKINAGNLPTLKIGNVADTRVGEWVLAIGSPFGFENSASAGIISAKARSLPDENYVPFIQTDVAVNPGNSGGPLFNMAGEVVGINSQIYSRTGGYQGVSFAIPIDVAMNVSEQIRHNGKVQRGRLGVSIQTLNQSLADSFGLSKSTGALVSSVEKNSPAARAGIEPGDVILALNGKEIATSSELPPIVANIKPGDAAKLKIWRKGSTREIEVSVGALKEKKVANADEQGADQGRLGLALRSLTPEERKQIEGKGGLLVEDVGGAAAKAGIRPGDVVLSLNGEPVTSVEQLRGLVAKSKKRVALLIQREDAKLFVPVDLG